MCGEKGCDDGLMQGVFSPSDVLACKDLLKVQGMDWTENSFCFDKYMASLGTSGTYL